MAVPGRRPERFLAEPHSNACNDHHARCMAKEWQRHSSKGSIHTPLDGLPTSTFYGALMSAPERRSVAETGWFKAWGSWACGALGESSSRFIDVRAHRALLTIHS
jgi:hypothetical protein